MDYTISKSELGHNKATYYDVAYNYMLYIQKLISPSSYESQ
jgi:hypothetical protein